MSSKNNWIDETPRWFWLSIIPVFGSLALTYAGNKAKTNSWQYYGLILFGLGIILSSTEFITIIWVAQVAIAFGVRKKYLGKVIPSRAFITNREVTQLKRGKQEKIEINSCSKDELVYELGLPIAYANDIEFLRNEGHIFTSAEELADLSGIPKRVIHKIEPLITFEYHLNKESDVSWRRLNNLSLEDLIACNLDESVAQKIIQEREKAGAFKSLVDVRKRTGLPLSYYQEII